ncbi:MAG: hypothetical protein M3483_01435, partial [Gemmatimonadota bacterium]|nr:hypothetical protein [Gemmatimonadota bacterium]
LFAYAASAASGPEGWQLAASDVRRFRELDPERRARISEWVARATALALILATVSLMGVQLASYLTAVGGASRAPWYAEVLVIIPLAVVLILSLRGGRALRTRLRGN